MLLRLCVGKVLSGVQDEDNVNATQRVFSDVSKTDTQSLGGKHFFFWNMVAKVKGRKKGREGKILAEEGNATKTANIAKEAPWKGVTVKRQRRRRLSSPIELWKPLSDLGRGV